MAPFREALQNVIEQQLCEDLDDPLVALALLGRQFLPGGFAIALEVANLAGRLLCNNGGTPAPSPPFVGGQCPVRYSVLMEVVVNGGVFNPVIDPATPSRFRQTRIFWGPIIRGNAEFIAFDNPNNRASWNAGVVSHGGAPNPNDPRSPNPFYVITNAAFTIQPKDATVSVNILSVTRVDGQPDNCGNPPLPPIPPIPPGGITHNVNVEYDDGGGTSFTVPVFLAFFNAFLDANLNLQIPLTISFSPQFNFNATFNLNTGNLNVQFAPRPAPPPGQPPAAPPTLPPPGGGAQPDSFSTEVPVPPPPPGGKAPDENEPPSTSGKGVIRGVIVTVAAGATQRGTRIFQSGGNPDIFAPSLGWVSFLIQVGRSTSWTADIPIKNVRTFIPCPWEGGAIEVAATPQPGNTLQLTPVYAKSTLQLT